MGKATSLRALITAVPALGATPTQSDDYTVGVEDYLEDDRRGLTLAAGATDQAVALIGDVSALVIVSTNGEPFKLRLKASERLVGPCRFFALGFASADDVALATADAASVLLTGNGTNQAELLVIQVKTTT